MSTFLLNNSLKSASNNVLSQDCLNQQLIRYFHLSHKIHRRMNRGLECFANQRQELRFREINL